MFVNPRFTRITRWQEKAYGAFQLGYGTNLAMVLSHFLLANITDKIFFF